jgi:hypothetical protein
VLRTTATVAQYLLLWPDKPSVTISILINLPNTLTKYSSMYKCHPYIHSAKTPVCPCINPAMTPITGFTLQPSYSNPCYQFHYYLLRATATIAWYLSLWPISLSNMISILAELPNMLAEYPSTYKCRPCIRFAKTPVCPYISPAVTLVTGFVLQPSYSNPCHQSRYYHFCRHKIQFAMWWLLLL